MKATKHYPVIIIGSGPAGLTAALYSARAELKPILFSGMIIHGQASLTSVIENYPGFPDGIGGDALGGLFQLQAERFGTEVIYDLITSVDLLHRPFTLSTYSDQFTADTIIISTGADPRKLNVPGEQEFTGKGVSYCATCDGWFFKEKDVAVVGGGDSALEEALFLTRFAKSIKIIHRRDGLRAGAILEERAKNEPKISFVWNSVVSEIIGGDKVENLRIKNVKDDTETLMPFDGVFVFIGHLPNSALFKEHIAMDDLGYIIIDKHMQTNIPGVFAAGEIADPRYRQVITSAGMGAMAAIEAVHYLENIN